LLPIDFAFYNQQIYKKQVENNISQGLNVWNLLSFILIKQQVNVEYQTILHIHWEIKLTFFGWKRTLIYVYNYILNECFKFDWINNQLQMQAFSRSFYKLLLHYLRLGLGLVLGLTSRNINKRSNKYLRVCMTLWTIHKHVIVKRLQEACMPTV
jgi:hypothetical protein